jgi:coproporphyrinogen III oxidase
MINKEFIADYFKNLQDQICQGIEQEDGEALFKEDLWNRPEGGGGCSRLMANGNVLEKGGVNFSAVHGPLHPKMVTSLNLKEEVDFFATGVSIVMHPKNPWVPIIHMNVRYFELSNGEHWFGGGIDLTPHIIIPISPRKVPGACTAFTCSSSQAGTSPLLSSAFSLWQLVKITICL